MIHHNGAIFKTLSVSALKLAALVIAGTTLSTFNASAQRPATRSTVRPASTKRAGKGTRVQAMRKTHYLYNNPWKYPVPITTGGIPYQ